MDGREGSRGGEGYLGGKVHLESEGGHGEERREIDGSQTSRLQNWVDDGDT